MSIRPDPDRPGRFIVDCRPFGYQGKRLRESVEGPLENAEQIHTSLMRKQEKSYSPPINTTIAGIYKQWIVYYKNNRARRTAEDAQGSWKHLGPHFGTFFPKNLSQAIVEQYKTKLTRTVKPRTVNKHLSYFSSMLKWAAKNNMCDQVPFTIEGFDKSKTRPPKPRPITQEQITKIYRMIEERYKLVFLLMADAGLRRNEALHLKRRDIEYNSGLIFVTGKGSKERIVPITTDRLRLEIEKRLDKKGYLTVNPSTNKPYLAIRKALLRAAKKADVDKHVHHHLLRHSFGTNATIAGIDLKAIQGIMGHSSPETTAIYQHLAGDYYKEQAKKLESRVHVDKIKTG